MTAYPHETHPLFAEPYFRANITGAITPQQIDFLQALPMVPHQRNLVSDNLYIFEAPELKSIADAAQETLDIYARDVLCIPQKFYVTQSWAQTQTPNLGMHGLSHSNSVLAGVLYYGEMHAPPPSIVFSRHDTYQQIELAPDQDKRNAYNTQTTRISAAPNEVILFSSRLTHMVDPNATGQPRHSIAFNTFVKGTLGSYRDVSELTL
jgi:Putative 2OG-Fe(II) oxygenase